MVSVNNSTSGAEAHLPFGGNGKSGNGSRQSGIWVLDQFTRWQSMNWDYAGKLQKAQMDVVGIEARRGLPPRGARLLILGRTSHANHESSSPSSPPSPQGRRLIDKAKRYAQSPEGRAKLEQVRRQIAARRSRPKPR